MIILKHLTVERFRLLREIDLHFPQRGSILIQGPNEAGKSTLFESIYFALYGESLTSKRNKRSRDENERYDELIFMVKTRLMSLSSLLLVLLNSASSVILNEVKARRSPLVCADLVCLRNVLLNSMQPMHGLSAKLAILMERH